MNGEDKECPVATIEINIEIIRVALKMFPNHKDRQQMLDAFDELTEKLKTIKCTCI